MSNSNCILIKWLKKLFNQNNQNNSKTDASNTNIPIIENEPTSIHIDDTMPEFLKTDITDNDSSEGLPSDVTSDNHLAENLPSDIIKTESVEVITKTSLLDNEKLVKIFSECADIIKELDRLSPHLKSTDSQQLLELINERLRQALFLSGGEPISNDTTFNSVRHICPDNIMAKDGAPIDSFIESGVILEDRVFVRAKVTLK